MNLPSYEDFIDSLTKDEIKTWVDDTNEEEFKLHLLPLNEKAVNENLTSITAINLTVSMNMLRAYHKWLSQQLSNQA